MEHARQKLVTLRQIAENNERRVSVAQSNALIIGASGGIGKAIVTALQASEQFSQIHTVSRKVNFNQSTKVIHHHIASSDPSSIEQCCKELAGFDQFSLVVCCIGVLHGEQEGIHLSPEKRLEDLHAQQLSRYFEINSIAPAMWLKELLPVVKGPERCHFVVLSARVGSISDNKIGGWYGYRASKAALNMLIKSAQVEYNRRAKNVQLVCYHPGTVDTPLSTPFQSNVPKGKLFTAEFTANQLLTHLPHLLPENAPHFIDWQGKTIPW